MQNDELKKNEEIKPEQKMKPISKEPEAFIAPLPGYSWNPLLRLEPNTLCPCQSGKKFKKCCKNLCVPAVPEAQAKELEKHMSRPSMKFLFNEDKTQMHIVSEMPEVPATGDFKVQFEN